MKRALLMMLCLAFGSFNGLAKSSQRRAGRAQNKTQTKTSHIETDRTVTVEGCIKDGDACLILQSAKPGHGPRHYSIARDSNLEVGKAYRIKGTVSSINGCQTNYPVLVPDKITKLDKVCATNIAHKKH